MYAVDNIIKFPQVINYIISNLERGCEMAKQYIGGSSMMAKANKVGFMWHGFIIWGK